MAQGNPSPANKIKKGQTRNPSGRSSLSIEGDKIRTMKYYEFMHLLHRCSFMTAKEITDWVAREEARHIALMKAAGFIPRLARDGLSLSKAGLQAPVSALA